MGQLWKLVWSNFSCVHCLLPCGTLHLLRTLPHKASTRCSPLTLDQNRESELTHLHYNRLWYSVISNNRKRITVGVSCHRPAQAAGLGVGEASFLCPCAMEHRVKGPRCQASLPKCRGGATSSPLSPQASPAALLTWSCINQVILGNSAPVKPPEPPWRLCAGKKR